MKYYIKPRVLTRLFRKPTVVYDVCHDTKVTVLDNAPDGVDVRIVDGYRVKCTLSSKQEAMQMRNLLNEELNNEQEI